MLRLRLLHRLFLHLLRDILRHYRHGLELGRCLGNRGQRRWLGRRLRVLGLAGWAWIIFDVPAWSFVFYSRFFSSITLGLTKTQINIRDLPLSGKLQSDLIQLEHRTPGVGVENGITPCRLSACSMLSSGEARLVGGLLPLFSQHRTDRG